MNERVFNNYFQCEKEQKDMFKSALSKFLFLTLIFSALAVQTRSQAKLEFKQWVDPTESAVIKTKNKA